MQPANRAARRSTLTIAVLVEHTPLVKWLLGTTSMRSIAARADDHRSAHSSGVEAEKAGFQEFDEMCVSCHGAPGVDPDWLGKGINPAAPDLQTVARQRSPDEIRLAIRRGIKFSAMSRPVTFASLEAMYQFFSNKRVRPEGIFDGHAINTVRRASAHDRVLIVHDTTEFRFGGAKERNGLGRVSTNKRDGFLAH